MLFHRGFLGKHEKAEADQRETQAVARPVTPTRTARTYGRARNERLAQVAEKVADRLLAGQVDANMVPESETDVTVNIVKWSPEQQLTKKQGNGGGGIRTPVPRCFKISVYMLSRLFDFRLTQRQTTGSELGYFGAFSPEPARTTNLGQPAV